MKRYVMIRREGRVSVAVYQDRDGGGCLRLGFLKHLVHHSPDGFEWGYGGSGPSDLARSIVGDVLGLLDPPPSLYQEVKRELVARIPMDGGEITEDEVLEVVRRP